MAFIKRGIGKILEIIKPKDKDKEEEEKEEEEKEEEWKN